MYIEDKIPAFDELLDRCSNPVIVSHMNPDGDAAGSTAAMYHYLAVNRKVNATVVLPQCPQDQLLFLCRDIRMVCGIDSPKAAAGAIESADLVICLDFNDFNRTGVLKDALMASTAKKVLIDHHLNPDSASFDICFSKIDISSASELLYRVLSGMKDVGGDASRLPSGCATALMAGMTTDTNNFANSVFPSTLAMASELLAAGVDRDAILDCLYSEYRENRLKAMAFLLSKMTITEYGVSYMILTKEEKEALDLKEGETEAFVNIPLSVGRVRISIFAREDEGFFRISIRSKKGISANELARLHFHGGGHELAAGGRLMFPEDISEKGKAADYFEKVTARFMKESAAGIV